MSTAFTFSSAVGSTATSSAINGTDGTMTAVVHDGAIEVGDAVTVSGFGSLPLSRAGITDSAFYFGTTTLNGATAYVFGVDETYGNNSALLFVLDGSVPGNGSVATLDAQAVVDTKPTLGTENACFLAGTMITTARGPVAVENLLPTDLVETADGPQPLTWIGQQTVRPGLGSPQIVRISTGALGDRLPHTDLLLTGDHALVLEGLLINASALVNGSSIRWEPAADLSERVTVYHVELPNHAILYANGAPSESFIDYVNRRAFDNYDAGASSAVQRIIPEMGLPRISSARLVPQRIAEALNAA